MNLGNSGKCKVNQSVFLNFALSVPNCLETLLKMDSMSGCNFQTQTGTEHFSLYFVTQVKPDMMLGNFSAAHLLIVRKSFKFLLRN